MRILAHICYDGSHFQGFQRLKNGLGVQNELERVLSSISSSSISVKGAGRTDEGVHALDQCIHFDFPLNIPLSKLQYIMNRELSQYVSVTSLMYVRDDFHARFCVKEKTYVYKIYIGEKNPLQMDYSYYLYRKYDLELMKECALLFCGSHDFRNFVSGERDNYVSLIKDVKLWQDDEYIFVEFRGQSFYRYMVRSMVGAIIDVGIGHATLLDVKNALENYWERKSFFVAPSSGLYLKEIIY